MLGVDAYNLIDLVNDGSVNPVLNAEDQHIFLTIGPSLRRKVKEIPEINNRDNIPP